MMKLETYSAFQTMLNEPFFVLVAKTEGCSVCKPVAMRIEQIMTAFPQVPLYQLDVEKVEEFRGQHLVFTVPTVLVFESRPRNSPRIAFRRLSENPTALGILYLLT
ncbi:MAG: thioredoxin family protein [Bacillus subtilis]|nr:thioredoxin family protein [Bacillus subtilis]